MSGSNQRRRRASGVLAEAIRKDLERDANAGADTDAHRRRERRNSAAFRRASFQAANAVGPAPPAGVKKLGKMVKDDDEMERQQQDPSARRRSSTTGNLVRRGSGSNVARRGSNGSSAPKGGTYPRRTSVSKRRSPVDDKKQAAKSSSPTTRHPQLSSDETDEDEEEEGGDDDDALIMACIANVESRSKPGYRPSPPTVSESSKSKQSTIASTKAERGDQGALDTFLESQKQERAALAYFRAQQAEASALLRATQNGADKVKKNSPRSSFTSTNTAPREEKPISSELVRHRARIKAAQEREDSAYTGMNLEEHKARIASRYGGDASVIKKSVKLKKVSSSSSPPSPKGGDPNDRSVKLKKASSSSSSPSPTVNPKKTSSSSSSSSSPKGEAGKEERKASSRSRKSKEATMPSKQPEKKKRELQQKRGSLHKLKDLPSVSSSSSPSKSVGSVSSSSRKDAILAASRRIRTQGYDDLSESHRSLTSTGNRSQESAKRGEDERYVDKNMRHGKKADGKARKEQVQAEGDAGTSSNLICDFGERRRDSGLSITEEDKRLVGSKAA